jgi:hypothetical protein
LNGIAFFSSFPPEAEPPAERMRRSADPVANTPEEIPLFGPTAIPGVKEGLVFSHTLFVRKNHTFVELLSLAGRCNLLRGADGVILIQDRSKACPFKT